MGNIDAKKTLSESHNPHVTCSRGHTYTVPIKFFIRNIRRKRDFICPNCLIAFKIKEKV